MSDRKGLKYPYKLTNQSNTKTAIDSSQKRTVQKAKPQDQAHSNRKNLMAEFEKAEAESKSKQVKSKIELIEVSSISESSISSSNLIEIGKSVNLKEDDYAYQLPKSYILAMSGLQEAVVQRNAEINRITVAYGEQKNLRVQLEAIVSENNVKLKENETKITELSTEVKILKETAAEDRKTFAQSQRSRLELETQLSIVKSARNTEKDSQQILLKQLKRQLQKIDQDYEELKREKSRLSVQAQTAKKELKDMKEGGDAYKASLLVEMKELTDELKRQNMRRVKAEEQIEVLRKQTELLAERTVIVQNGQEQNRTPRKPLLEMALTSNQGRRESLSKQISQAHLIEMSQKKTQIAEKWSEIQKKTDLLSSAQAYGGHARKSTNGSVLSRERSMSRMRSRQNCGELVSQYRELMRYQKEFVGLNYQLQVLEKGLAGQSHDKGDIQKNYAKLKRECEQKEMQIRQLKNFLNDPLK